MRRGFLKIILKQAKTVFSFKELLLLWPNAKRSTIKSRLNYYVHRGDLYHIRRGLYSKDNEYNRLELATKIFTPSYISFETVLLKSGIIFQHYSQIFVASYQTKTIVCDKQTYVFRAIKPFLLTNTMGVEIKENYSIASPERAFLDMIYIYKEYYFDNLSLLNWDMVRRILPIYKNKRMEKLVANYQALAEEK